MIPKSYKYSVARTVKTDTSKIKNNKEISDELFNKEVTIISTCIVTHATTTGASVGADITITKGNTETHKIADIDASHQL